MTGGVQLALGGGLPVDPREVAKLLAYERAALYSELDLSWQQREAVEAAVRLVIRREYGRRAT